MSEVEFETELASLISRHSQENGSSTPDFLLARYLVGCLRAYEATVNLRDGWFGFKPFDRIDAAAKSAKGVR